MKKIITFITSFLISSISFGQSPEKMSYQPVLRDSDNVLVINQQVGMQISILQGADAVYVETQTPVTNNNGLVSLEIGNGSIVTGDFSDIDWSVGTYFIKTETDLTGGAKYTITGTSQILSVPYSLHAKTAVIANNGLPAGGKAGEVLKIDDNGVPVWVAEDAFTFDDMPSTQNAELIKRINPLYGKDIYSFGDSLAKGFWEKILADLTGANFIEVANDLTSAGGSNSIDSGGPLYNEEGYVSDASTGGVRRAKNFVLMPEDVYGNKDVIFFENVHDNCTIGANINDYLPSLWQQYTVYEKKIFSGSNASNDAQNYFNNNLSEMLALFNEPKPNSIIKLQLESITKKLTFTNGAKSTGNVTITINGVPFATSIVAGDSIEQIIDKINIWNFNDTTGWMNSKESSSILNIIYKGGNNSNSDDIITFDDGGTGVIANITDSISKYFRNIQFKSLDITEWEDVTKWRYLGTGDADMIGAWKGIIEHIKSNYPNTQMYMCLFPNLKFSSKMLRPDGSFNMEEWKLTNNKRENNRYLLTEIANYYNIPIIDIESKMMVSGANWQEYYPENNVHYKNTLNKKIAEIIAESVQLR
ncbi:SGNH/GDSL hydrolase family protein [Polaribacter sp. R77954]|uniref:SGNH/GDSL hydrolase family protein n=1 Tax=Polaribacter sp. R77954 TaxID=3093870 RepID=UPI0037C566E5